MLVLFCIILRLAIGIGIAKPNPKALLSLRFCFIQCFLFRGEFQEDLFNRWLPDHEIVDAGQRVRLAPCEEFCQLQVGTVHPKNHTKPRVRKRVLLQSKQLLPALPLIVVERTGDRLRHPIHFVLQCGRFSTILRFAIVGSCSRSEAAIQIQLAHAPVHLLDSAGGSEALQFAPHHDANAAADGLYLGHGVRRCDDRLSLRPVLHFLPQEPLRNDVHARGELVEEQNFGVRHQRDGKREPTHHAAGVLADGAWVLWVETNVAQDLLDECLFYSTTPFLLLPVYDEVEFHVLLGVGVGEKVVVELGHDAHLRVGFRKPVPQHVLPEHGDVATGGRPRVGVVARKHREHGRLARSVRAQKSEALPALHAKRDAIQSPLLLAVRVFEALCDALRGEVVRLFVQPSTSREVAK
mmetsp:Transcript_15707/g.38895  ORF Transcript_15707/g.38895 Transcript_15707/m.38895 type:complete len:409 (-) Transcript_15707:3597-4823(-)